MGESSGGDLDVWVVDDEDEVASLLSETLRDVDRGLTVQPVSSIAELAGLAKDVHQLPDIAFLDRTMPGGDPMEFLASVAQRVSRQMLWVRITGYEEDALPETPDHVRTAILPKPFDRSDLVALLKPLLTELWDHEMKPASGSVCVESGPHIGNQPTVPNDPDFSRGLAHFMQSLPTDPEALTDDYRDFSSIFHVLRRGLNILSAPDIYGDMRQFKEMMLVNLPVQKRKSFLALLEQFESVAPALALDCLWHDLNNAMIAALGQDPARSHAHISAELIQHLKEVSEAFTRYDEVQYVAAFSPSQKIDIERLAPYYPGGIHCHNWNPSMQVHAPVGALHSIMTTFPNNALRVGTTLGEGGIALNLSGIGPGRGEALVVDGWRGFTPGRFAHVFDHPLESQSWGTGLWRLARVMKEVSPNAQWDGESSLGLYQRGEDGLWQVKMPGASPTSISEEEVRAFFPGGNIPDWVTKAFRLRFLGA